MSSRPPSDNLYELAGDVNAFASPMQYPFRLGSAPLPQKTGFELQQPFQHPFPQPFQQSFQQPFQQSFQQPLQQSLQYSQSPYPQFQQLQQQQQYIYPQDGGLYSPYSMQGAISFAPASGPVAMSSSMSCAPMQVQRDYIDLKDGIQVDCGNGVHIEKTHNGTLKKLKKSKPSVDSEVEAKKPMKVASEQEVMSHVESNMRDFGFQGSSLQSSSLQSLQSNHKPKSLKKAPAPVASVTPSPKVTITPIPDLSNELKDLKRSMKQMEAMGKEIGIHNNIFTSADNPTKVGKGVGKGKAAKPTAKPMSRINVTSF